MTVKMYSSWDALAVILNCKLPRYDPATGPTKGYALKINVLFAKWSGLMSGCLAPKKFYPPVYCVFYTDFQSDPTPETSQRNIFLLSVGKVVDLETGTPDLEHIHRRVAEMLVDARRDQLYKALPAQNRFDTDDNPLEMLALDQNGHPPTFNDLTTRAKNIFARPGKPVTKKTWNEFCTKYKPSNSSCKNLVGACAETWGFQFMLQVRDLPSDCYYSIALGQDKRRLNSIKLGPGYRYSRSGKCRITKGICNTCCFVACAIKAKYNITLNEITDDNIADISDTANSNPVSTTPQDDGPAKGDQEMSTNLPRKQENETTETELRGTPRHRGSLLDYISSKLTRQTNVEEANS